ncbi:hypothetical protein [Actinomadura rubrisoli]|uniref:Uncharacterized protein n=1 Tax=Actinomadura rubrisoli TaxID=2530368 RepID=A0A4R5CKV6_9ACTN|nr:hypothetical protein [Actinomadura rubrisoli]TDD98092.1 hypothetical protein E1298_00015 [Actinomadura rubrisoli]
MGGADDVAALAGLLTEMSGSGCAVGEVSAPYSNRRGSGVRRYLDVVLTGPPPGQGSELPPIRDGDVGKA